MPNREFLSSRSLFLLPVLYCILFACGSAAQAFLFVSPNTREHMTEESAWKSLESFEQSNFLAVARYLAGRICARPAVWSVEGMDGNNTENSSLIAGCSLSQAEYLGELLARYAHQKWLLLFEPDPDRKERLLIITFSTDRPADIAQDLRQFGISTGTILVEDKAARLYLWVNDRSKDAQVLAFVTARKGKLEEIAGTATLIGNTDRTAAQHIFDRDIHAYEHAHHLALSKLLWSRQLRDLGLP